MKSSMAHGEMTGAFPRFDRFPSAATSSNWDRISGSSFFHFGSESLSRWGLDAGLDTQTIAAIFHLVFENAACHPQPQISALRNTLALCPVASSLSLSSNLQATRMKKARTMRILGDVMCANPRLRHF